MSGPCPNGHIAPAGSGCAYCTGQEVSPGFNDLATLNPKLAAELVTPEQAAMVTVGSGASLEWKCGEGHVWTAPVNNRARGRGCPYCTNRKVWAGFNDLATTHPELATELSFPAPTTVTAGSTASGTWVCAQGHSWTASIRSRAKASRGCPYCSNKAVLPGFNDLATTHPEIASCWSDPEKAPTEVTYGSKYQALWVCEKGHYYRASVADRQRGLRCAACAATNYVSVFEKEVAVFVAESLDGFDVLTSHRGIRNIRELDIYIPHLRLAIECNGVYYHSEAIRPKAYHAEKRAACSAEHVRLVQVWEDDWKSRPETVKTMLLHKLGISKQRRFAARSLTARMIPLAEARPFLEANHIQGWAAGTYYLALVTPEKETVAVMSLKRQGRKLILERYATSAIIAGGQSKLIRFLETEVEAWDVIVTFADLEVSDGGLYEKTGWTRDGDVPPDYKYAVRGTRYHKFGYRLKRFKNDPALRYEEGLTERELAALNGLLRVWDSGKTRYIWERR